MKEVTYADWIQNPTPRLMWVWDFNKEAKEQQKMSEKNAKKYRYVWRNLERNAVEHYESLTFFQKLKWRFNKKKYVNWYIKSNKQYYFYSIRR